MENQTSIPLSFSGLAELARGKTYTPSIYGKAVLNNSLLRGNRFCRFNRSAIELRKVCVNAAYKTNASSKKSTELTFGS